MGILILLLAAATIVASEPLLYKYDYPYLYNRLYSPWVSSPVVRGLTPEYYSAHYDIPYYAGLKSQYYDRDLIGQARYGHIEPGQSHHAIQDAYGNKVGGFSYYNAEGKLKQTSYIADAAGYRVSSNDLPVDTPEVAAAKISHLHEHEKVKSFRAKRDVLLTPGSTTPLVTPFSHFDYRFATPITHTLPTTHAVPVVKPDGFLADTPEVTAAKALHFAEYEAAKARTFSPIIPTVAPIAPVSHIDYRYISPITYTGVPIVTKDGFLADTPEVAAEKARHFSEVAKAKARVGYPFIF